MFNAYKNEYEKYGLIVCKNNKIYSPLYDRIVFPVYNVHNKLIAFTCRVLDDHPIKYYNTVYFKTEHLCFLNDAYETIRMKNKVKITTNEKSPNESNNNKNDEKNKNKIIN